MSGESTRPTGTEPASGARRLAAAIWRYDNRWLSSASIGLVLLFALGGALYHFVYVAEQRSSLHEHHLHLLRRAAADVEATLTKFDENIRNATRGSADFRDLPSELRSAAGLTEMEADAARDRFEDACDGLERGVCHALAVGGAQPRLRTFLTRPHTPDESGGEPSVAGVEADLHRLFAGLFPIDAFDTLLLIRDSDGTAIYDPSDLLRPPQERRGRLGPVTFRRYDRIPDGVHDGTAIYPDTIAGEVYTAFAQPVRVPFALSYGDALQEDVAWHLVGLRQAAALASEARLIPPIWLLIVIVAGVVALLALPVLKVGFVGARERLAASDVVSAALAVTVASALLTAAVAEGFTYAAYRSDRLERLGTFADDIEESFQREIAALDTQLAILLQDVEALRRDAQSAAKLDRMERALRAQRHAGASYLPPDTLDALDPRIDRQLRPDRADTLFQAYPFMIQAFWTDRRGEQLLKVGTDAVTPRTAVPNREYFRFARDGTRWMRERSSEWYLESIRGKVDGQVTVALSKPPRTVALGSEQIEAVVPVVTTRLLSLHAPVLPAGMGFGVVGARGQVLFHHDETKNLRENFFGRIPDPALAVAVTQRVPDRMNVTYWNRSYEASARPLAGTPWTLVVMDDLQRTRSLYGQVLVFALTLSALYFFLLVPLTLGLAGIWRWRGRAKPFRRFVLQFEPGVLGPRARGRLLVLGGLLVLVHAVLIYGGLGGAIAAELASVAMSLLLLSEVWRTIEPEDRETARSAPSVALGRPWGVLGALLLVGGVFPALLFYRVAHDEVVALRAKQEHVLLADALQDRTIGVSDRFRATLAPPELCGALSLSNPAMQAAVEDALYPSDLRRAWDVHLPSDYRIACGDERPTVRRGWRRIFQSTGDLAEQHLTQRWHPLRAAVLRDVGINAALSDRELVAVSSRRWSSVGDSLVLTVVPPGGAASSPQRPLRIAAAIPTFARLAEPRWLFVVLLLLGVGFVGSGVATARRRAVRPPETCRLLDRPPREARCEIWLRCRVPAERAEDIELDVHDLRHECVDDLVQRVRHALDVEPGPPDAGPGVPAGDPGKPAGDEDPPVPRRIIVQNLFEGIVEVRLLERKLDLIERLTALVRAHERSRSTDAPVRLILCSDVDPLNRVFGLRSDQYGLLARWHEEAPEIDESFSIARWAAALRPFEVRREPARPDQQRDRFLDELLRRAVVPADSDLPAGESADPVVESDESVDREEVGARLQTAFAVEPGGWLDHLDAVELERLSVRLPVVAAVLEECWMDYRLRAVGLSLVTAYPESWLAATPEPEVREHVIRTLLERAEPHYRSFWELSSKDEKVTLYRLATDGLVGRRSRPLVDCLEDRDLVRRRPYPEVVNESFRRFVTRAEAAETYERWLREEAATVVQRLTPPVLLALTLLVMFLLLTQPSLINQSLALAAALGAALPAIARIAPLIFGGHYLLKR